MILYTSQSCAPCKQLKDWLERMNVQFKVRDVKEHMEAFQKLGVRTVPTMTHEGSTYNGVGLIRTYVEALRGS